MLQAKPVARCTKAHAHTILLGLKHAMTMQWQLTKQRQTHSVTKSGYIIRSLLSRKPSSGSHTYTSDTQHMTAMQSGSTSTNGMRTLHHWCSWHEPRTPCMTPPPPAGPNQLQHMLCCWPFPVPCIGVVPLTIRSNMSSCLDSAAGLLQEAPSSGQLGCRCCCCVLSPLLLDGWSAVASRSFRQIGQLVWFSNHLQPSAARSQHARLACELHIGPQAEHRAGLNLHDKCTDWCN
jgi:hypothetical protein